MTDFTYDVDKDGIAIVTWDCPDKSMNVLTREAYSVIEGMADKLIADDAVKGMIITSGKKDFAGGMDLNVLASLRDEGGENPAEAIFNFTMGGHKILRKIERNSMDPKTNKGGKPIVCAIPGTCAGIGTEIALACHHRIMADGKGKIGLPEILVGLFPGGGDEKGYKMPGGAPYHPAGFMTFVGASAMVHGKTQGVYPAAKAMLSAIYEGALVPFDDAIRIEARWFTKVIMDPTSSAMIRSLFINKQALEKGAVRPDIPDESVKRVGILGAGMMGAGIAYVSAMAGIEVVLIDRDQEAADKGKSHVDDILTEGVKRKKTTEEKKAAILGMVTATPDYDALKDCDLIVEAVFEDPKIKAEVTQKTEAVIPKDAIFATNTSTLPITDLAKASMRPEQFIGIHFFSPVHKMMLVEIIKGEKTGDRAVAKALDFVRQIRKTPIVVNDARFFYANRCIIPYIKAVKALEENVLLDIREGDVGAILGWGFMPWSGGPLSWLDMISAQKAVEICDTLEKTHGERFKAPDLLKDIAAKGDSFYQRFGTAKAA